MGGNLSGLGASCALGIVKCILFCIVTLLRRGVCTAFQEYYCECPWFETHCSADVCLCNFTYTDEKVIPSNQ